MTINDQDPDVVRWGLHLLDICSISNSSAPDTVTHYGKDLSQVEYVREGYYGIKHISVENDEAIAQAFQEELSRLSNVEAFGSLPALDDQRESILAQDWSGSSRRHGNESSLEDEGDGGNCCSCSSTGKQTDDDDDQLCPEIADEITLDGEVGKRLNQMFPVPHVPKINGEIPSVDDETSDHQRLMDRLQLYDLVELKVLGDGNCQITYKLARDLSEIVAHGEEDPPEMFRSLSDQIYRTTEHHEFVREQIVIQLEYHRKLYEGYVPMAFDDYLKKISKAGEWGDHVTLQAASDSYGVKIFVITSFKDTCYIEILPHILKSNRIITLSFWAEVHYNSIYPQGDLPEKETKKKKSWWIGS